MAKLLPSPSQRAHYLQLAERDLDDALHSIEDEPSGCLAIRGHVRLLQGAARKALADFEEVRRLREVGGDLKGLGESLTDVGLAHMRLGHLSLALKLLREGVANLEDAGNPTFAIRAKKRLAQALLLSGHPMQAVRQLSAVHEAALENQIYDQMTPMTDVAYRIVKAIRI